MNENVLGGSLVGFRYKSAIPEHDCEGEKKERKKSKQSKLNRK